MGLAGSFVPVSVGQSRLSMSTQRFTDQILPLGSTVLNSFKADFSEVTVSMTNSLRLVTNSNL